MERSEPLKPSSRLHGSSIFTKSQNSEKYEKVRKRGPKSDPQGGTKIDFVTPFASELVVWWRQLSQIRALADPRCKKRAKQAPRTPTNSSKTPKNKEKPAWKVPRRDPALKKNSRAVCEAAKTQGNIMAERRAPPKTRDGPQKKHERRNERHPTRMMQKNIAVSRKPKK